MRGRLLDKAAPVAPGYELISSRGLGESVQPTVFSIDRNCLRKSRFHFHQLAVPQLNLPANLIFLCIAPSSGFLLACCGFSSVSYCTLFGAGVIFISMCCTKPNACKYF